MLCLQFRHKADAAIQVDFQKLQIVEYAFLCFIYKSFVIVSRTVIKRIKSSKKFDVVRSVRHMLPKK